MACDVNASDTEEIPRFRVRAFLVPLSRLSFLGSDKHHQLGQAQEARSTEISRWVSSLEPNFNPFLGHPRRNLDTGLEFVPKFVEHSLVLDIFELNLRLSNKLLPNVPVIS